MKEITADPETELRHARAAIWLVAQMGGENVKLAMQYIGWFVPQNDKLSFEQVHTYLAQIQTIWNDSTSEQWQSAIKQMLADKVSGSLKMPLNDHLALEDYLARFSPTQPENDKPTNAYPSDSRLSPKPEIPPFVPPTAEQKAQAAERLQAMKQTCSRTRRIYPND
ncbi:hypothetical protein QG034_10360 [Kingella kingae]|uniref:hypothetical protein n=1 Tax=Kingella kingae TaxID=504 RepID=UPI00050A0E30|nr:hypothetical protein [Kingella kingae]MDK4527235.1 hypothetical protein [Kingella kingae]MDK4533331.1 hypothetical protein [Kingella kingae]